MIQSPIDVIIGEYYNVPYIISSGVEIPVLLPSHENNANECLLNAPKHFHIDYRFIDTQYHNSNGRRLITNAITDSSSGVKMKTFKALRDYFDSISFSNETVFFFINRWYRNNKNSKIKDRICSHNGTKITNSCGTCPAHGLKWDLNTGKLDFKPPFFLELSNDEIHNSDNPCGVITDQDECEIEIKKDFNSNGKVIMVDSSGRRYGKMVQIVSLYRPDLKMGDTITFNTNQICSEEIRKTS